MRGRTLKAISGQEHIIWLRSPHPFVSSVAAREPHVVCGTRATERGREKSTLCTSHPYRSENWQIQIQARPPLFPRFPYTSRKTAVTMASYYASGYGGAGYQSPSYGAYGAPGQLSSNMASPAQAYGSGEADRAGVRTRLTWTEMSALGCQMPSPLASGALPASALMPSPY